MNIEDFLITLLSVEIAVLPIKTASAIAKLKSIRLPPITSPKESCGIFCMAEFMPIKKFGAAPAIAITKKATTNSFHPKKSDIFINAFTSQELDQKSSMAQRIKIKAQKNKIIRFFRLK